MIACAACGNERHRFRYRWSGGLQVHRCERCGLLFTDPMPSAEDLARSYRSPAHDGHMRVFDEIERFQPVVRRAVERILAIAADLRGAPPRSFLDVAGGTGLYAWAAQSLGLDTWYLEIDPRAAAFARDRLGLPHVLCADVATLGAELDRSFDVVLARHCIEHVREPGPFVTDLARRVAPGGFLLVETPNGENWEQWAHPHLFRHHWAVLRAANPDLKPLRRLALALGKPLSAAAPPKHLYGFTRRSLAALLDTRGFRTRRVEVTVCGDETFDPLYYRNPPVSSRSAVGRIYSVYERAVSALLGGLGRGSNLAVFAEKIGTPG